MVEDDEPDLASRHDELTKHLTLLARSAELDAGQQSLVLAWRSRLEQLRKRAEAPLTLAFMAQVGRGKSTLIAAATGLRLDVPGSPKKWSVLPVGDGRTTLGETQIELEDRTDIALEVEPVGLAQLSMELRLFAEDLWEANTDSARARPVGGVGEEFHAVLRAWIAPEADDRRAFIDALARESTGAGALYEALVERLDLDQRVRPLSMSFEGSPAGLGELQTVLGRLMRGELDGAPVPKVVRLRIPRGELGRGLGAIVDTRGIDSRTAELSIRGRADLRARVHDPDTLLVICSEFESAPDPASQASLASLEQVAGKDNVFERRSWRLLIVDKREPEEEAEGQRRLARERAEREAVCRDRLRQCGHEFQDHAVVSIDARSEPDALRELLIGLIEEDRMRRRMAWVRALREADESLADLRELEFAAELRELDLRLWWLWDKLCDEHGSRLLDPFEGIAQRVSMPSTKVEHWSHLHAAIRRRGRHDRLDLVALGVEWIVDKWFEGPLNVILSLIGLSDNEMQNIWRTRVAGHGLLRAQELLDRANVLLSEITASWTTVLAEYFASPRSDDLWTWCEARRDQGPGYMAAVAERFREEAQRAQLRLTGELAPGSLEDCLPPRPALFSLQAVQLQNFRGIEQREIPLSPTTTVLVGQNGVGKTTWLEAIALAVGALLPGMGAGPAPALRETDIRQEIAKSGGVSNREPQPPMEIAVEAIMQGRPLRWRRRVVDRPNGKVVEAPIDETDAVAIKTQEIAKEIGREVRAHGERQLPVFAYYGTQRLWPPSVVHEDARREPGSRLDGYNDCLCAASDHRHMLEWVRKYTYVELQRKEPVSQLHAIEQAVLACVEEAASFEYDLDLEDLVLHTHAGEIWPFRLLSDGYRNIVALAADIAWRAARLNPQLGARAPLLAEGVVLIDEIDLHLHPRWQRRVLVDLRRAFPRLQFVVTSHSPFIIQSLEPGQLVNLAPDATDAEYVDRSPEDITEEIMGVPMPQRSARRQREAEVARQYYELLDRMPDADADELARIGAELDELTAPYNANQAFVALLERKRAIAEARAEEPA